MDPGAVEVPLLREEHEAVHGLGRGVGEQLDDDVAARGLEGRRVDRTDLDHLRRRVELRLGTERALGNLRTAGHLIGAGLGPNGAGLRAQVSTGARTRTRARVGRRRGGGVPVVAADERGEEQDTADEGDDEGDGDRPDLALALLLTLLCSPQRRLASELPVPRLFGHGDEVTQRLRFRCQGSASISNARPSRMSVSETSASSNPNRPIDLDEDHRARHDHVGAPRAPSPAARRARPSSSPASRRRTRSAALRASRVRWMASGS